MLNYTPYTWNLTFYEEFSKENGPIEIFLKKVCSWY